EISSTPPGDCQGIAGAGSGPIFTLPGQPRRLEGLLRAVGAADERAGLDVADAAAFRLVLERRELLGRVEAPHREMLPGRLEVLADGHDVEPDPREIVHDAQQLLPGLAVADLEAGLRE